MPPFSRMQLAAALIEYDNDPEDPDAPYRSAQESAIFSFLGKRNNPRNTIMGYDEMPRKPVDYLKVGVPTQGQEDEETRRVDQSGHVAQRSQDIRRSTELLARPSSEMARLNESMFRGNSLDEEEEPELDDTPPLNLASWGVDSFLAKEEPRPRSRASSINALNRAASPGPSMRPRLTSTTSSAAAHTAVQQDRGENRRSAGYRARSLGDWGTDRLKDEEADEQGRTSFSSARPRATSIADPSDLAARNQYPPVSFRNRSGSASGMQPVAFPVSGTPDADALPNPFELAPPSPAHTSRFDPKYLAHQRNVSFASMNSRHMEADGRNFADNASVMTAQARPEMSQRYSSSNLLRPKVLVMPQLLQEQVPVSQAPKRSVREGYLDSTDARPMPPGAKTETARLSTYGSTIGLNNRSSMTLSQIMFRNSLMVGGQRDPSFADLESHIKRAEYEGQMIEQEVEPEPELMEEDPVPHRAAGKLYGRSLIDDLEARKAQLKSKQRVFRGDERPSMMQRPQIKRGDTLISVDDLQKPQLRATQSQGHLLSLDDEPIPGTNVRARPQMGRTGSGLPQSRSVFGVDQVWEKELAKLKQIEAMEKVEEEERLKFEEEKRKKEEEKATRKAAKKGKGKNKSIDTLNAYAAAGEGTSLLPGDEPAIRRTPEAPPLLPAVNPFPMPAKANDTSSESDSDYEPDQRKTQSRMQRSASRQDWLSDDERQAAAVPRPRPRPRQVSKKLADGLRMEDDSEDDDVPLTTALAKAKQRQAAEDSEEDKPLAAVLNKAISTFDFGGTVLAGIAKPQEKSPAPKAADSDDDDKPLGLQHPGARQTMFSRPANGESDDEQPLGMRFSAAPSQMMMQQQQQMMMQQQMMAAQMRSSMFNPMFMGQMGQMGQMGGIPGMGMGFPNSMGMPTLNPGMMPMSPMPMGDAGGAPDTAKFGRVDRWRRDVGGMADG